MVPAATKIGYFKRMVGYDSLAHMQWPNTQIMGILLFTMIYVYARVLCLVCLHVRLMHHGHMIQHQFLGIYPPANKENFVYVLPACHPMWLLLSWCLFHAF